MTTIISKITDTENVLVNCLVATALTVIVMGCLAVLLNLAFNPEVVNHATFGVMQ